MSLSRGRAVVRKLVNHDLVRLDLATKSILRARYDALLEADFANAQFGSYPKALLFETPFSGQWHLMGRFVQEVWRQRSRAHQGETKDFAKSIDLSQYPEYFCQNFHWQTDGYLSETSAELYNLSVEFLFMGLANVMRRQVIPPITRYLRHNPSSSPRILDVACGTGELLQQMIQTHPSVEYTGIDLSGPYLKYARKRHPELSDISLMRANAEEIPFRDNYFDAVTSVYLMHELPRDVRKRVIQEMLRVTKPGGLIVVQDSVQANEVPRMNELLMRYGDEGNEPYFHDYLEDDLKPLIESCGAQVVGYDDAFVAKVITARKQ